jgi:hypothetical protein
MLTDFVKLMHMHLAFLLLTCWGRYIGLWGRIFRYASCLLTAFHLHLRVWIVLLVTFIIVSNVADHYNLWQPSTINGWYSLQVVCAVNSTFCNVFILMYCVTNVGLITVVCLLVVEHVQCYADLCDKRLVGVGEGDMRLYMNSFITCELNMISLFAWVLK